jgi:hypothetical protein
VELLRPGATEWELGPAQQKFRAYHSVALMLPDGSVLSAGDDYWSPSNTPDPTLGEDTAEVYKPPYLFSQTPRPRIVSAPQTLLTGDRFRVAVADRQATRAVLMAPGAVTHGNDMNQRHVELQVVGSDAGGIDLVAPPSTAVAPPGWYMLFVLDANGTPSVARWVQVKPGTPTPPPTPTPTPPGPQPTATPTPTPTPVADTRAPKLRARLLPPGRRRGPARLKLTLDEAGSVRVSARAGSKRTRRTVNLRAGRTRTVGVALPRKRRVRVTVNLQARDLAGNRAARTLVKMLRR